MSRSRHARADADRSPAAALDPLIRVAVPADAGALARLIDAALTTHFAATTRWYPGTRTARLRQLTALVRSSTVTRLHWSLFWVADAGGALVGAIACYRPDALPPGGIADAVQEIQGPLDAAASAAIVEVAVLTAPRLEPATWVLDHWTTVDPPGDPTVLAPLVEAALGEGRRAGAEAAYAEVPVGGDELRRAYQACGLVSSAPAEIRVRPKRYRPVECFRYRFA